MERPPALPGRCCRRRSLELLLALVLSLLAPITAAAASDNHWWAIDRLRQQLSAHGVQVVQRNCGQQGLQGLYHRPSDTIVICRVHDAPLAVWNTLAHEATHRMQVCLGGPITDPRHRPLMLTALARTSPEEWRSLQSYPATERLSELEARYTAQLPPEQVLQLFELYCGRRPSQGLAHFTPPLP
ncbi:hypothetical protein [Cyanobium sp. Morenito 9A2]|uniref:hypothetical protein n=1 Tax=Cyanobium sp. Morenito 9A2 TaxID=2823718 RepID=UPI0020CC4FF6|nr:hypothetical protein [Cyanobium sp. Morenito 9A2]MCP9848709.1 hypothetical protein [Cyanobium sp. Morenito 9A2]